MDSSDYSGDESSVMDRTIVSNEILGNVLRGFLYNQNDVNIFNTIDNSFDNDEVYEARKILVKFFHEFFENESGYMGPKEREIRKDQNILDIIETLHNITKLDHDVEFCIPWDYSFVVISEEEKRFREMVRQKDLEMDNKFQCLETVIERKNRAMITAVKSIIEQIGSMEVEGEMYIHSSDAADPKGFSMIILHTFNKVFF